MGGVRHSVASTPLAPCPVRLAGWLDGWVGLGEGKGVAGEIPLAIWLSTYSPDILLAKSLQTNDVSLALYVYCVKGVSNSVPISLPVVAARKREAVPILRLPLPAPHFQGVMTRMIFKPAN